MKYYNLSLTKRLLFSTISGAMIYPLSFLENNNPTLYADISLIDVIIGAVFALFVMMPFQKRKNWFKSILLIVASIAIYTSMMRLAVSNYNLFSLHLSHVVSVSLSGGFGALLTGIAVQYIAPIRLRSTAYPLLIILGLISGYVFSTTINSNSVLINSAGYIIWQTLVCLSIAVSKK